MDIVSIVLPIVSLLAGLTSVIISRLKEQREQKSGTPTIEAQIGKLSNISNSLDELKQFISDQKTLLEQNSRTIEQLEAEKAELEPIVSTHKETVEAILSLHAQRQKKSRKWDYLIGFFIGIASSAIVGFVFYLVQ